MLGFLRFLAGSIRLPAWQLSLLTKAYIMKVFSRAVELNVTCDMEYSPY